MLKIIDKHMLNYIISYLCISSLELYNFYSKNNIIVYKFYQKNYNEGNSMFVTQCILNIKIVSIISNNKLSIIIYKNDKIISSVYLINWKPINNKIKIIEQIEYLDKKNIRNILIIYNTGIIIHKNHFIQNIYNFKGEKRLYQEFQDKQFNYHPLYNNSSSVKISTNLL